MHPLLKRQLRRFIGEQAVAPDALPTPWREFVAAVGEAYEASEAERKLTERSMELASQELNERNELLVQKNSDLHRAMERAEAANTAKSSFLANMSHEIRTPMSAILGYADMLLAQGQTQEQRMEQVATIRQQGKHLLAILNDILDLSKIEADKLELERIDCDFCQIIAEAVSLMRVRAVEKKIDCAVTYLGPMPESIRTDPTRLRQILMNLIGNAIKFTERGGVQIVVSMEDDSPGPGARLRVEVIDSGIGMTAVQLEDLFKPFAQGDASTTRRFGGTGLGLSISKRLAHMLGGDIRVQSRSGCGSRFILTVDAGDIREVPHHFHPREARPPPDTAQSSAPADADTMPQMLGRVLLAEDGVLNQRVFRFYLEAAGAEVVCAENGLIAVELARGSQERGEPFDLILLDMQMPELDGYGAAARLRSEGFTGPIIALTANAMAGDREKCLAAGCSDHLSKPVERTQFIQTIQSHLARKSTATIRTGHTVRSTATDPTFIQFVPLFIDSLATLVDQLHAAQRDADAAALHRILHDLKGSGAMYGFEKISTLAASADELLLKHNIDSASAEISKLFEFIGRIEGFHEKRESARC